MEGEQRTAGVVIVGGGFSGTMLAAEGTAVVSAPPSDQVSSASAALSAARQSGISLGIALLGAVAALSFRAATESGLIAAGVDPAAAGAMAADATIGSVNSAAQQGSEMVGGVLLEAAGEALVLTFLLAALALVASLALGLATTLRRRRVGQGEPRVPAHSHGGQQPKVRSQSSVE